MAQHDYVIANGTGAAVRSDLNNALAAIVSQNSGATAPATTYAYQFWADTTTGTLKLRNSANSAWIELLQLDGTLTMEDGTEALPGLSFRSDLDTGLWRPGTNQLAISTNAVERVEFGASEVVFNDGGANYDFRVEGDTNANLLFVDASADAVGIGTSSPDNKLSVGIASADEGIELKATYNGARVARFGLVNPGVDNTPYIGSVSGNDLGFITSNTRRMTLDASGRLGIGTTSPYGRLDIGSGDMIIHNGLLDFRTGDNVSRNMYIASDGTAGQILASVANLRIGAASNTIFEQVGVGERARIDNSGRLLVGTSSARAAAGVQHTVQVETTNYATLSLVNNTNDGGGCNFSLGKSRGASVGSATVVQSGDVLGAINFLGADGTDLESYGAQISAVVDGTPGNNDMPGRLVFSTTADGASSPTEAFRINSFQKPIFGGPTIRCLGTYNSTTASAANQFVDSAGDFYRSTSSIKYKTNVETIEDHYSDALLQCRPVWYQSTCEADNPDWGHWGFIAEEVAQIDPRLCFFKEEEDGSLEPEGVQYDRFVPHLLNLIKRQQQAIEDLQAEVAALKAR